MALICCFSLKTNAQLNFRVWSNNYFEVSSYLGKQTINRFNTFQFDITGSNYNLANWSLKVHLTGPITIISGGPNRSRNPFPPQKISLNWTEDSGDGNFNLNGIGASRNKVYLQDPFVEVPLISNAQRIIKTNGSSSALYYLYSMVQVESGLYLDDYLSPTPYTYLKYRIPLQFTLYNSQGIAQATENINYEMQFLPTLTDAHLVDVNPDYLIELNHPESAVNLIFQNENHYKNGVSTTVSNALRIKSKTDYEVRIKSVETEINKLSGGSLPLSVLSVQLLPGLGATNITANPLVILSNTEQIVINGNSNNKNTERNFDIKYQANLNASQYTKPSGAYEVSIIYLLLPK